MPTLTPGDLFTVPNPRDRLNCKWLVVREHENDINLLLLVPLTDQPLVGWEDVIVPPFLPRSRRYAARCGANCFVSRQALEPRVEMLTVEKTEEWAKMLEDCNRVLSHLACEISVRELLSDSVSNEERQLAETKYDYFNHKDLTQLAAHGLVEYYGQ